MFSVVIDASGLGMGGVLHVFRDGKSEAAAFYSRQLRGTERQYSPTYFGVRSRDSAMRLLVIIDCCYFCSAHQGSGLAYKSRAHLVAGQKLLCTYLFFCTECV